MVSHHGNTFESVAAKFRNSSGENICCVCVYRPGILNDTFFDELDEFIGGLFVKFSSLLFCGDLNIHLDLINDRNTVKFSELISSYGLTQLVNQPTHVLGHCLDTIFCSHKIVKPASVTVNTVDADVFPTCDHYPITFNIINCSI